MRERKSVNRPAAVRGSWARSDDPITAAVPVDQPARPAGARRSRRCRLVAGALAVLLVGTIGVGAWALAQRPTRLASATLEAFPGWAGQRGTAVLERRADGREVVEVRTTVRPDDTTDHEVWLMTDGAKRLVSQGLLRGEGGTFRVPAGVDVARFHLVDVSDEPRDGNPAHSGDSIVRGALRS